MTENSDLSTAMFCYNQCRLLWVGVRKITSLACVTGVSVSCSFWFICKRQSNDTDKRFGHLAEQSPLSLSFKLLFVLLWRISFSSVLLSSPLFPSYFLSHLLARWWRCVSQVAHSSKHKGSGSLFQTKTSHSLLSKGKDVDEDLPRRICPPHCPPKAVSAPCCQREMSIKRGHEVCWKGHRVVVIAAIVFLAWMEKTIQVIQLTSLWTNSPFRYTERKI